MSYLMKVQLFRAAAGFIIVILSLILFGCAKPVVETVIYVPQKCAVDNVIKPQVTVDKELMNLGILQYCETLEAIINRCR